VNEFSDAVQRAADEDLLPLLWRAQPGLAPERSIGVFMSRVLRSLMEFMNSAVVAHPQFAELCVAASAAQNSILMFLRLLGPPVRRDPLHGTRLAALGTALSQLSLRQLVCGRPWPTAAVLAVARHLAWRSHRIFREVPLSEVRRALELGAELLAARTVKRPGNCILEGLRTNIAVRHHLWEVASSSMHLGAIWHQVARWLASGEWTRGTCAPGAACKRGVARRSKLEASAPQSSPVYLSMGFGAIEDIWLQSFLNRALDVGIQRLSFVTPDSAWLLTCEKVHHERKAEQAKFYLMPIFLTLGVDVAWLDLDIFIFRDPTRRLLEQMYARPGLPRDVIVTDHFDEHCLNHGVFMVRASDRALLWMLQYIQWLHWYPFGHDQNGWDAFLGHSIVEPQLPAALQTDPELNTSYRVLSTELEYVTLTGWAGTEEQRDRALLLHFTTTKGITFQEKKRTLMNLFNATAPGRARRSRIVAGCKWQHGRC